LIMAQARNRDEIESAVHLTVATTVEPMAVGLAGRLGNRSHAAQMRECRF
jgi:hypothetical protein